MVKRYISVLLFQSALPRYAFHCPRESLEERSITELFKQFCSQQESVVFFLAQRNFFDSISGFIIIVGTVSLAVFNWCFIIKSTVIFHGIQIGIYSTKANLFVQNRFAGSFKLFSCGLFITQQASVDYPVSN